MNVNGMDISATPYRKSTLAQNGPFYHGHSLVHMCVQTMSILHGGVGQRPWQWDLSLANVEGTSGLWKAVIEIGYLSDDTTINLYNFAGHPEFYSYHSALVLNYLFSLCAWCRYVKLGVVIHLGRWCCDWWSFTSSTRSGNVLSVWPFPTVNSCTV